MTSFGLRPPTPPPGAGGVGPPDLCLSEANAGVARASIRRAFMAIGRFMANSVVKVRAASPGGKRLPSLTAPRENAGSMPPLRRPAAKAVLRHSKPAAWQAVRLIDERVIYPSGGFL